jgi:hypothetical protein
MSLNLRTDVVSEGMGIPLKPTTQEGPARKELELGRFAISPSSRTHHGA